MADRRPTAGRSVLGRARLMLRFLPEQALLAALAVRGDQVPDPIGLKVLLGIGAPARAITIWGAFITPRSP